MKTGKTEVVLVKAMETDAEDMLELQIECFSPHYARYQDESSPAKESLERMIFKINFKNGCYYKIMKDNRHIGGIFAGFKEQGLYRIEIIYISPQFQCKGIGQHALAMAEKLHPEAAVWELDCPSDLVINRRCYEKAGYILTGETKEVNDKLTLVFYRKKPE